MDGERDLECLLEFRAPRWIAEEILGRADRRQRMGSNLVEAKPLRHGECVLGELQALGRLAGEPSHPGHRRENASSHWRRRAAGELLCAFQMSHRLVAETTVPPDVREKDLGFGCGLAVPDG